MTTSHFRESAVNAAVLAVTLITMMAVAPARAQSPAPADNLASQGTVQGHVRDSNGRPVANALVFLQPKTGSQAGTSVTTHTDFQGKYSFAPLGEGAFIVRAEMSGYHQAIFGPIVLMKNETKTVDLTLGFPATSEKLGAQAPEFFDEPQFTVAGITQATNSGGHGSDTVLRTTEALAKATLSLSKEPDASSATAKSDTDEVSLRGAVTRQPGSFAANQQLGKLLADQGKTTQSLPYLLRASQLNAKDSEVHHLLGNVEEQLGNPLEAVREYQRASEIAPTEPNLFDWGTELLTHRALEPATEVFTKGNRLFPTSVRILVALGVALYARGSYDQATQCLVKASDLAPDSPTPYLFLGKMQSIAATPSEGSLERLARFAQLQPDNALANYYYAVGLTKQSASAPDSNAERTARVETLLRKAVQLDPKLAVAHLQLGILYSQRADFPRAIAAYQKAIEVSPAPDETLAQAHYRLAQAYLRTGEKTKAQEELKIHDEISKKTKESAERQRREIQEFVISQQGKKTGS
ncbi:MAG: carboxypeptidase regulatory-like domain-containing protein [Terriglobales bacterium]